ncbi:MAG: TMEM175 family protein [Bacteriovoracaceae bacterium]
MNKNRLEAFSDGVIAIIITIMVLELKVPHGHELSELNGLIPVFISYVLSFIYGGIYWNNHHHMFHAVQKVTGPIMWANLHLLFWLSIIPFVTAWAGENHFAPTPVLLYGIVLFMCAIAYFILSHVIINHHGKESAIAKAFGSDLKGKISTALYLTAVLVALPMPVLACAIYILVAIIWLVPDTRMEKTIKEK